MGIVIYSLLWVMQGLSHQPQDRDLWSLQDLGFRGLGFRVESLPHPNSDSASFLVRIGLPMPDLFRNLVSKHTRKRTSSTFETSSKPVVS